MPIKEPIPDKEEVLDAIAKTEKYWETIKVEDLGSSCPLCNYIRTKTKTSWKKAEISGTCELCPVYYFGLFSTCVSIMCIPKVSEEVKEISFKWVKEQVHNSIVALTSSIINEWNDWSGVTWNDYQNYVKNIKSFRGTIIKNIPNANIKKPKIYKRRIMS